MSRVRRLLFDRLKASGMPQGRLPYGDMDWWDKQYEELAGRTIEWGNVSFPELQEHRWCPASQSYLKGLLGAAPPLRTARLDDSDLAGPSGASVLIIGGGTSRLSLDMSRCASGTWPEILDVDFAPAVVEQLKLKDSQEGGGAAALERAVADARNMRPATLPPSPRGGGGSGGGSGGRSFSCCIDKGLVDALWCSGPDGSPDIPRVAASVASVLKPGGRFLVLSYTDPQFLDPLLLGMQAHAASAPPLWKSIEARKLQSLYLYVLVRSKLPFAEQRGLKGTDEDAEAPSYSPAASDRRRRKGRSAGMK